MRKISESFEKHDTLNPKLWDSNNKLLPQVREKIEDIVAYFINSLPISVKPVDVHLVGSNASYNYSDTSDLDVHIIVNFDMINAPKEIVDAYLNGEKSTFNKNHDIVIKGIDVELYIEDIKSTTISNGIYSMFDDEWIKFPEKLDSIPYVDVSRLEDRWAGIINDVLADGDSEVVEDTINTLYMIRKNSIDVDGEYGKGNVLFKAIRSAGLLQKLKDRLNETVSKELSLESLTRKEAVHYLNEE